MAGVDKTAKAYPGACIGNTQVMVKIAETAGFLAATGLGVSGDPIVELGYDKAVKVLEMVGSILWLSEQDDDGLTAMMESSTFPQEAADIAALEAELDAISDAAAGVAVTTSTALNGDGTFTYA